MAATNEFERLALLASPTDRAQEAADGLGGVADWVPLEEADAVVALGGDGFMLHMLHQHARHRAGLPGFGMNRGTVGFLMNHYRDGRHLTAERIGQGEALRRHAAAR